MKKITKKEINETTTYSLSEKDILNFLFKDKKNIIDFSVHVKVPGGGDWSNENLYVDSDSPIIVTVKQRG